MSIGTGISISLGFTLDFRIASRVLKQSRMQFAYVKSLFEPDVCHSRCVLIDVSLKSRNGVLSGSVLRMDSSLRPNVSLSRAWHENPFLGSDPEGKATPEFCKSTLRKRSIADCATISACCWPATRPRRPGERRGRNSANCCPISARGCRRTCKPRVWRRLGSTSFFLCWPLRARHYQSSAVSFRPSTTSTRAYP